MRTALAWRAGGYRQLAAGGAGVLLGLAFPSIGMASLAWLAPGLLLFACGGLSRRERFLCGYTGGLLYYLVSLHWILYIPVAFGNVLGWLALSAFLALYLALWVWLVWEMSPVRVEGERRWGWRELMDALAAQPWWRRAGWFLLGGMGWVAMEMVQARFLSGFPWNLLGVSQWQLLPLIQMAEVTGVYGVSGLVAWFSIALVAALAFMIRRPIPRWSWLQDLAVPGAVVAGAVGWGSQVLDVPDPAKPTVRMALVQPSVPQTLIWDPAQDEARFAELLELTETALAHDPEILVWPEAAVPNLIRYHERTYDAVAGLVRKHDVWLILGADDAEPRLETVNPNDADFYNSAFLVDRSGQLVERYRKRQLVIMGEYTPLARWLPFLAGISPAGLGFTAGERPAFFELEDLGVTTSILICYEDNFPHLAREYVRPDVDFLVNLTNNGWFGESAAQWQHAANSVFRAVENRLPLVRCTNNGLTCWIDRWGRMHAVAFEDGEGGGIYRRGVKVVEVPILPGKSERRLTIYGRYGDWFGWSCVGVAGMVGLVGMVRLRPWQSCWRKRGQARE